MTKLHQKIKVEWVDEKGWIISLCQFCTKISPDSNTHPMPCPWLMYTKIESVVVACAHFKMLDDCASHSSAKESSDKVLECRQEVKDFAVLMEQKLRKNDHKKHWRKCNQEYLLTRLDEEVKELHECFFIYSPADLNFLMDGQHEDRIPGEAVDVANFAMMLWDNFGEKELRTKER